MRSIITAAVMFWASLSALAQDWTTQTNDDVFSGKKTAVMMGMAPNSEGSYFDCNADGQMTFSIIVKVSGEKEGGVPGIIVAKVDDGGTYRFDAQSYEHNDKYMGFLSNESAKVKDLVKEIGTAKKSVLLGLQIDSIDVKETIPVGVSGSTFASREMLKACER